MDFIIVLLLPVIPKETAWWRVQTVKSILKKGNRRDRRLLSRVTSLPNSCSREYCTGFSPAQLLMGHRLRSTLPSLFYLLQPKVVYPDQVQRRDAESKSKQASYFDGRHGVRDLKELHLQPGDHVLVWDMQSRDWRIPAILHQKVTQRSHQVKLRNGVILRRNRHKLKF